MFTLIMTSVASTSFAAVSTLPTTQEFKFKYYDLESQKILLEKSVRATSRDEALDKAASACFTELRQRKIDGGDAIDICVNPRG